jgi:hypothetical protein
MPSALDLGLARVTQPANTALVQLKTLFRVLLNPDQKLNQKRHQKWRKLQ